MDARIGQGIVLQRQGRLAEAEAVYRAVLQRSPDSAEALHYIGLVNFQAGKLEEAAAFMSRSLEIDQSSANTWNDLGAVKLKIGDLEESVPYFARALELKPSHPDALRNIAASLRRLYRFESALEPLRQLSRLRPRSAETLRTLADTLYHTGAVAESIALHHQALHLDPSNKAARMGVAEACESAGKFNQARWHYIAVLRRDPGDALALSKLLQLREGTIERGWVTRAQQLASKEDIDADRRNRLNIGLAYHFDRVGEYDSAFRHLKQARDSQARLQPFNSGGYTAAVDALIEVFAKGMKWPDRALGSSADRPIFIVGMPRSGTTLTEQVLASHPLVAAGGELAALPIASYRVQELAADHRPYPYGLKSINRAALQELTRSYLEQLDKIDTAGRRVTDKLPFNFMHLAIVAFMFPGAKVVHCRRDPLDNCTSCYFTSFAPEVGFAADLGTLGRYYADYHRLMTHWREVLPFTMFELDYEELVTDTEAVTRRLLEYCELDWDPACLQFHKTQREIRTPSRWQVRQPIYGHSVARWRRYENHLEPLKSALGTILDGRGAGRDSYSAADR